MPSEGHRKNLTTWSLNWSSAWDKFLYVTSNVLPGLTAGEITKLSWAKLVKTFDDLPDIYKVFLEPLLDGGRPFPYSVLTPSMEGFIHPTTEKLVCDFGEEIYIFERSRNKVAIQCYPLKDISIIEAGTVLLDSWIKISGVNRLGIPSSTTFKFNSVTDYLFTPVLEKIRFAPCGPDGNALRQEKDKFDQYMRQNFKFMNYARRSLLAGDRVVQSILQPEIRLPQWKILSMTFYRTVSPAHMIILTDRELIVIREDTRWSGDVKYGGIWDYIPLNKIESLSLSERDDHLLVFSVQLPRNDRQEYLFQASARQEIELLIGQFQSLAQGVK